MKRGEADDIIDTDLLVIGSGGAGCWAAIAADDVGVDVTLVSKGLFTKDGATIMATGAINVGISDPSDNPREHFIDTVEGGDHLNDQKLVKLLCEEIIPRMIDVETLGLLYDRTSEGKIKASKVGGHRYPRTTVLGDWTGSYLMQVLGREVMRRRIRVLEEFMVTRLLTSNEKAVGAAGLDMKSGAYFVIRAPATILACGGAGQIYEVTSTPAHCTGDGYALAYKIGAELINMEETQFHPTGLAYPSGKRGVLVTELCRSLGGRLFNGNNERYMFRYDSRGDLAPRDVVARANWREVAEGRGSPHNGVWLDCSYIPQESQETLRETYLKIKDLTGVNMWKERFEVAPTVHFFMGGVRIKPSTETTVPGLFACGEVAGGVHGANRLGANAINELFVFGYRAGKSAAEYSKKATKPKINWDQVEEEQRRIFSLFKEGKNPFELRRSLQELMTKNVGVERSEEGLKRAIESIKRLKEKELLQIGVPDGSRRHRRDLQQALELSNLLETAEMVGRCALYRTESRGGHYRVDYPKPDDENWLFHTQVKLERGKMTISKAQIEVIG